MLSLNQVSWKHINQHRKTYYYTYRRFIIFNAKLGHLNNITLYIYIDSCIRDEHSEQLLNYKNII